MATAETAARAGYARPAVSPQKFNPSTR